MIFVSPFIYSIGNTSKVTIMFDMTGEHQIRVFISNPYYLEPVKAVLPFNITVIEAIGYLILVLDNSQKNSAAFNVSGRGTTDNVSFLARLVLTGGQWLEALDVV